jgi:hypothetical protein
MTTTGIVITEASASAGLMAWWRLSGDVRLSDLHDVWVERGLDAEWLPKNPSPEVALSRVAHSIPGLLKVRATVHTAETGWAVVAAKGEGGLGAPWGEVMITIALQPGGEVGVHAMSLPHSDALQGVQALFARAQEVLTTDDVSSWLSDLLRRHLHATSLRDTGGVYYVPETDVATYRNVVEALKPISGHRLFEVPAMKTEKAVEAILAAVLAEAETAVVRLETDLDTGDLGTRALHTREAACEGMRQKLELYEGLLGRSMDAMGARLEGLKAGLVAAALSAASEET